MQVVREWSLVVAGNERIVKEEEANVEAGASKLRVYR